MWPVVSTDTYWPGGRNVSISPFQTVSNHNNLPIVWERRHVHFSQESNNNNNSRRPHCLFLLASSTNKTQIIKTTTYVKVFPISRQFDISKRLNFIPRVSVPQPFWRRVTRTFRRQTFQNFLSFRRHASVCKSLYMIDMQIIVPARCEKRPTHTQPTLMVGGKRYIWGEAGAAPQMQSPFVSDKKMIYLL